MRDTVRPCILKLLELVLDLVNLEELEFICRVKLGIVDFRLD